MSMPGRATDAGLLAAAIAGTPCASRPLPFAPEADASAPGDAAAGGFVVVPSCPVETDYATGTDTVRFGAHGGADDGSAMEGVVWVR